MSVGRIRFVEFIGFPGSGKTTIATSFKRILVSNREKVYSKSESFFDGKSFLVRHVMRARFVGYGMLNNLGDMLESARLIQQGGQASMFELFKVTWNFWCVLGWYSWCRKRGGKGTAVVDQGLIQAVWSIRFGAIRVGQGWKKFLIDFGIDDVVFVIVLCDASLARQRLEGRNAHDSRMESLKKGEETQKWSVAEVMLSAGIAEVKMISKPNQIWELTNTKEACPDQLARYLVDCQIL